MNNALVAFGLAFVIAMPATAQDKSFSMVGTWEGSGTLVSIGESLHPEHRNTESEPKVVPFRLRYVIEKQVENNFWGHSMSPSGTSEPLLGSVARDGKRGVAINSRGGQHNLVILDANTIETCYAVKHEKFLDTMCAMLNRKL